MTKKLISSFLSAVMAVTAVSSTIYAVEYGEEYQNQPTKTYSQKFSDVSSTHWAFSYIGEMEDRGVLNGYPDGRFYPENNVSRAEFAKIMTVTAGIPIDTSGSSYFYDTPSDEWYTPYINAARPYLGGYKTPYGDCYYPDTPALREDIAVALVKLKGYDTNGADESILTAMFTDTASISNEAKKYVAVAVERGLVSGYDDRTFRGQASITRAEAAAMLWRAYQYGNDNKVFDDGNTSNMIDQATTPAPTAVATTKPSPTPIVTPTPKPTVKPTPTPEPTIEPTPTPTLDPTPTPEPPRPYEMDTITKANVASMTCDNNDNVYYYDKSDNMVYMINMDSERINDIIDVGNLTMREDGKFDHEIEELSKPEPAEMLADEEYSDGVVESIAMDHETEDEEPIEYYIDFEVKELYYDKQNERLLLEGSFQHITDWQRPDEKFDSYEPVYIDITDSDKPILFTGEIYSSNSEYRIYTVNHHSETLIERVLQRYNYNTREWETISNRYLPDFDASGLNSKGDIFYLWNLDNGNMFTCDTNGVIRQLDIQSRNDIYIIDKTDWPYSGFYSNYVRYLHPCNNGKFVFYDTAAQAIRVIRER